MKTNDGVPRVFLAYASEDHVRVKRIYEALRSAGLLPWMDKIDLLPGQNWQVEIPSAVKKADFFLACFSKRSIGKNGYVQKELLVALDTLAEKPQGSIYFIPTRLDKCVIPDLQLPKWGLRLRDLQWIDLFESNGLNRIFQAIQAKSAWKYVHNQVDSPHIAVVTTHIGRKREIVELNGLDEAISRFKQLIEEHRHFKALVICTDKIAEFLRKQKVQFFADRQFTFLVLDDCGDEIAEREKEIEKMGSREVADYDIRRAIRGKIEDLMSMGGPATDSIVIKRYDLYPVVEIWLFDEEKAIFGLLQKECSTADQKFIFCNKTSCFFPWLRRYFDYVDRHSRLDERFSLGRA